MENTILEEDRNISRDSDGENRVATPTATESQLPWKRQGDEISDAVQQNEFPAWASNKEYLAYNSPSATFLGKFLYIYLVNYLIVLCIDLNLDSALYRKYF